MKRWSLHLRLFAAGAASVIVALALAALGLSLLFNAHVQRRAIAELNIQLDQVLAGIDVNPTGGLVLARPLSDPRFSQPLSGLYWQVDGAGGMMLHSRSLWDYSLPLPAGVAVDSKLHVETLPGPLGGKLLVVVRRVRLPARLGQQAVTVAVAMDRAVLAAEGQSFLSDMAPYLALLALFLIAAGWAQVAIGLRPLATVGARVAAVRSGESARLGEDFPTEVRPLVGEVDALIAARELDVVRARARAGDLAHGLKTPLQALFGETRRLRGHGESEAADAIESIAEVMHRHIDRELTRARIAARAPSAVSDLAQAVDRVVSVVRRTPAGAECSWDVALAPRLLVRIELDDLTEALGALLENAARHARARITLRAEHRETMIALIIRDDGPGIPEDRIAGLIRRGARLDTSGPGTGLGLSIATEIVEAVGGGLILRNADPGLEARIELPEVRA